MQHIALSRLARAVAELALAPGGRMPMAVMSVPDFVNQVTIQNIAVPMGYNIGTVALPLKPGATTAEVGRDHSEKMSRLSGPTIVMVDAIHYDGRPVHDEIITGVSRMAAERWSIDGQTFLLVITPKNPAPLARLVGETLGRGDWTSFIPL